MSTQIHHECPRCNESIFFDEENQVCDECEWGLDDPCECGPASINLTTDLESDQACKNTAHTLYTRLKQLKEENPNRIVRANVQVRETAHSAHPTND